MQDFESFWIQMRYSKPTSIYGFGLGDVEMPPKVEVNTEKLFQNFHDGFDEFSEVWQKVLTSDVYQKLLEIKGMKKTVFTFPTDLWARLLYDVAISYRDSVLERDLIMDSIIPLYFGKTLSFVKKTEKMSIQQAEEAIEEDCMTFEMTKPYLVQKWMEKL